MNDEMLKKIAKAEKLRTKPSFPFSLFARPDYTEAGGLLYDVAKECTTDSDKIKFYKEAAYTFSLESGEYNLYRAGECYKKLFDLYHKDDTNLAVESYSKYCECCAKIEKYMFAGQGYTKLGDYLVGKNKEMAISMYKRAQQMYAKDNNCPIHFKEAIQKCLAVQMSVEDLSGAIDTLEKLDVEHAKLSRQLLAMHLGRVDVDEELNGEESALVMTVLNKGREEGIQALKEFRDENVMMPGVSKVFDFVIDRFQPENDIC